MDIGETLLIATEDKFNLDANALSFHHEATKRNNGNQYVLDVKINIMKDDGPAVKVSSRSNWFSKLKELNSS